MKGFKSRKKKPDGSVHSIGSSITFPGTPMAGQPKKPAAHKAKGQSQGLHDAARAGDLEGLQAIYFSSPTVINVRDNHSRTPLHLAAWSGQTEVVEFLCNYKADVGAAAVDDMAAIHFASQKGHLEIVRILLRSGASVNACTRKGMSALHYAVQGSHLEVVKFLIRKGGSLSAKTKAGKRPIDLAKDDEVRSILTSPEELSKSNKKSQTDKPPAVSATNVKCDIDDVEAEPKEFSTEKERPTITQEEEEDIGNGQMARNEEAADIGPQPKKAKVALSHLVDDHTQEEF